LHELLRWMQFAIAVDANLAGFLPRFNYAGDLWKLAHSTVQRGRGEKRKTFSSAFMTFH
jgi:hypothetical protein